MRTDFKDGVYSIDNGDFILRVDESHRILNAEEINEHFHVKIPTSNTYTIERLLQHEQVQKYKELKDYLEEALASIKKDDIVVLERSISMRSTPILISSYNKDPAIMEGSIKILKTVAKCLSVLIIIWVVVIVLELSRFMKGTTTLDMSGQRYFKNSIHNMNP